MEKPTIEEIIGRDFNKLPTGNLQEVEQDYLKLISQINEVKTLLFKLEKYEYNFKDYLGCLESIGE